jgi:hypothetical protein|tara:strand:+ start:1104 stop:1250 length:147 start_codon:yes stop_codon:yes gene_type:complete
MENVLIERKADKLADKFAGKLFKDGDISVQSANSIYVNLKKLLIEKLK